MDSMMYKIEGEDLYLIGTSEHSMIGKFIDTNAGRKNSFHRHLQAIHHVSVKKKGAHGIEERGVYRIHQFEKQEMIVVCKPEESKIWYDKIMAEYGRSVPFTGYPGTYIRVLLR